MNFKSPTYDDIFQPYMNAMNDKRLPDFELTYTATLYGDAKNVTNNFYSYAISYLKCAEAMMEKYQQYSKGIKIFYPFSTVLPVMYNCRHAVELIIKAVCQQQNQSYERTHNLIDNWKALNINNSELEKFVKLIETIDPDGMTLRYPYGKKGETNYIKEQTWANAELLVRTTGAFIEDLKENILNINHNQGGNAMVNHIIRDDRDYEGMNLKGQNLSSTDFAECNFEYAVLKNCNLSGANFEGANLAYADLSGADLTGAIFRNTCLYHADLTGSDLRKAKIESTNFEGARLEEANFESVRFAKMTPRDTEEEIEYEENEFNGVTFEDANLKNAIFKNADLSGVKLTSACLENADLSGADFFNANLLYANLKNAEIKGANFERSNIGHADGLEDIALTGGSFKEADFSEWELSNLDFKGACLVGACFTETKLKNIDFSQADLTGADFTEAQIWKDVKFSGTNLTNAIFIDADIEDVDLSSADTTGTDFTNAILGDTED